MMSTGVSSNVDCHAPQSPTTSSTVHHYHRLPYAKKMTGMCENPTVLAVDQSLFGKQHYVNIVSSKACSSRVGLDRPDSSRMDENAGCSQSESSDGFYKSHLSSSSNLPSSIFESSSQSDEAVKPSEKEIILETSRAVDRIPLAPLGVVLPTLEDTIGKALLTPPSDMASSSSDLVTSSSSRSSSVSSEQENTNEAKYLHRSALTSTFKAETSIFPTSGTPNIFPTLPSSADDFKEPEPRVFFDPTFRQASNSTLQNFTFFNQLPPSALGQFSSNAIEPSFSTPCDQINPSPLLPAGECLQPVTDMQIDTSPDSQI